MDEDYGHGGIPVIPASDKDITEAWIQKVVGMTPIPNTISVEGNIQDGIGYLSYMYRVSFETKEQGSQHILVKLLPQAPEWQELALNGNFDIREVQFYNKIVPRLIEVDPSLQDNLCTFYYETYSDRTSSPQVSNSSSMLVMEDLKPLGYQMYNPESDLWEDNLIQVIKIMARFHCASLTLEKITNSKISDMFPFCMGAELSNMGAYWGLAKENAEKLNALLLQMNVSFEVQAAYRKMGTEIECNFRMITEETLKAPCLIHGDIWHPNIMIVEGNNPARIKLIDWQAVGCRDPTTDLVPAILSCLPLKQITKQNLDRFSRFYYETCVSLGNNMGRSSIEFQKCFDTWGMAFGYLWFLFTVDSIPILVQRQCRVFELCHEYKIGDFLRNHANALSN